VSGQLQTPATLTKGEKTQYPLNMRLDGGPELVWMFLQRRKGKTQYPLNMRLDGGPELVWMFLQRRKVFCSCQKSSPRSFILLP